MFTYICLATLFCVIFGELKVGITEEFSDQAPHFATFIEDDWCTGFECDIAKEICNVLNEGGCSLVRLPDLESRFSSLERGEVDFTISQSSVTPERAERVHFVRPYYYYAGAMIYVLDSMPQEEHPSWQDVEGLTLCTIQDYYASEAIELRYKAKMLEIGTQSENVLQGRCFACVTDSTDTIPGMVPSSKSVIEFGAPYGIATSHEDSQTLGSAISGVLVSMMNQGNNSKILEFEEKNLVTFGLLKNQRLTNVVDVITAAGGPIPPTEEDALWEREKIFSL